LEIGLIAGLVIVALSWIARRRKGSLRTMSNRGGAIRVSSPLPPEQVFERLVRGVDEFEVEDSDLESNKLLLSSKPTFSTWGFFYPVFISEKTGGGSEVDIAVNSRLIQIGPLVTKWQKKCATAVCSALGGELPKARVVPNETSKASD